MRRATLLALTALVLVGCEPERQRTSFELRATATLPTTPNEHGWALNLTEASIQLASVRFFPGHAIVTRWQRVLWAPFGGFAFAHPGHFEPGEALAEWTGDRALDLLQDTPIALGTTSAFTGDYGSAAVTFAAGDTVRIAGSAVKDDTTVRFTATLTPTKPLEGIRSEHDLSTAPTTATLRVDVAGWLARIDFTTAGEPDAHGVSSFPSGSQALNAFTRGVTDPGHWSVEWTAEEAP